MYNSILLNYFSNRLAIFANFNLRVFSNNLSHKSKKLTVTIQVCKKLELEKGNMSRELVISQQPIILCK